MNPDLQGRAGHGARVDSRRVPDFSREVHCLLGLPFDAVDLATAEERIRLAAARRSPCWLSTPNLNFLIACRSDAKFRDSVINSDLSVADGMPLVWLAKLFGIPIRERVAGSTLFDALRRRAGEKLSIFFFGGAAGVAAAAGRRLNAEAGGLTCVGHESPGFGSIEEMSSDAVIARINAANADFLVVSLGARKGQAWIEHNRHRLNAPVVSHLGAVVNFIAGNIRRAPVWMQKTGLEWQWRIKEEPGLWRRYFADGIALIGLLATRVLPHALRLRTAARRRAGDEAASIDVADEPEALVIRLGGHWCRANLGPLRVAFAHAADTGKDVRLDLAQTRVVDSAFLGLSLLLYGFLTSRRRRLVIAALNASVRRTFELAGADFMLDPSPAS